MSDTAAQQLNRLVQLVAELSRGEERGTVPERVSDLAGRFGISEAQLLKDVRVLTDASDDPGASWLASLTAYQEGDRLGVRSLGPYRRPIRLTAEEAFVLQLALATESESPSGALREITAVSEKGMPDRIATLAPVPVARGDEGAVVNVARLAAAESRRLRLTYAGADADGPSERVVWLHEVVYAEGRYYLLSWCESARGWRRFRADRVLEAELLDDRFDRRSDVPEIATAQDLFHDPGDAVEIEVRFSQAIARWVRERYPDAREGPGGSLVVRFRAAGSGWVIRTVLQYGPEAEVLGPPAVREAIKRAVDVTP